MILIVCENGLKINKGMKYLAELPPHIDGYTRRFHITHMHANHKGCSGLANGYLIDEDYLEIESNDLKPANFTPFYEDDHFYAQVNYFNKNDEPMRGVILSFECLTDRNFLLKWWDSLFSREKVTKYVQLPTG
jgi:hypothetical protein